MSTVLPGVATAFTACLAASGCYTDHINAAPVAHIVVVSGDIHDVHIPESEPKPLFSGTTSTDPDGDKLTYAWEFHTCPSGQACLPRGYFLTKEPQVDLQLAAGLEHAPVQVLLTVKDSHGATATDSLMVEPLDTAPTVDVKADSKNLLNRHSNFTVGRELTVNATPSDPDTNDSPTVHWSIVSMPSGAHPEERDLPVVDVAWPHVIRPDLPGTWKVQAVADDGFGKTATSTFEFTVEEDLPPCIEAREPDAPIGFPVVVHRAGGVRTFRVDSVEDEFDAYPFTAAPDDRSGEATFQWSTGPEGTLPQAVPGQVTSAFTLDPATLPLGQKLVVRVDAHDRVQRACAADSATCASEPDESCLSRYSWTVEVR